MFKTVLGVLIVIALIAGGAAAREKKRLRPRLTPQVLDTMYAAQENLARLRFRSLQVYNQRPNITAIRPVPRKG